MLPISRYIGEIKLNDEGRWNEHNNPTKNSESSKHLPSNIYHFLQVLSFQILWTMLRPGWT